MPLPFRFAILAMVLFSVPTVAAEPPPSEKQTAIQNAMATARKYLDVKMPAEAITALEAEILNADGNKAFLTLLREAYLAELYRIEHSTRPDATRSAQLRRNLALLGGTAPAAAKPEKPEVPAVPPPSFDTPPVVTDTASEGVAAFKKGDYTTAARLFATSPNLTAEQKTAWVYCRVKLAADRVNTATCDAATAAAAIKDVTDALTLVPQHADLQKVGHAVIAAAKARASLDPPAGASENTVETASFIVRHSGNRELAETVAKDAEASRKAIFERWSGPVAGAWDVKCEIVIHPTAAAYAKATGRPAGTSGTATVRLADGRATERRIDLRADDAAITANALPREMTHVVLADLFPDKPAPKWAIEGMAILAGSPEEVARYTRTLPRCAREGDWFGVAQLMELKDFPADKITGFYCESVSLTDYLIRVGGNERNFTIFLRECQRYGTPQALKRQYGIDSPQSLETTWKRLVLEVSRGQGP